MVKKKSSGKTKNVQIAYDEPTELVQAPHSFVIHRGLSCPYIQDLTKDFRRIMEPFTAMNLKERKSNKIKDYISLSGHFHVSHMCIFNKASTQLSFKIVRLPRGPTLTFKIHQFTLARDVIASTRKQFIDDEIFQSSPLVIMNNFSGEGKHVKLMANTFQNMFPSINLATINLSTIRRCVLYTYNPITKFIEMRHYSVVVVPVGLSRGVKKVVLGNIPNLSRCNDIADYFTQGNYLSDSEYEDEEANQVILPQNLKRKGNLENNKSAVRLHEIGPRCTFELVKIEDGLLTGEVLFHETVIKTEEQIEIIRRLREKKKKLKEQRKKLQKENKLKNDEKNKVNNRDKKRKTEIPAEVAVEPDNDAEYYKEEIGEEPDEELFKQTDDNSRKRVRLPKHINAKRRKLNDDKLKKKDGKDFNKSSDRKSFKNNGKNFKNKRDNEDDKKSFNKNRNNGKNFKNKRDNEDDKKSFNKNRKGNVGGKTKFGGKFKGNLASKTMKKSGGKSKGNFKKKY